MIWRRKRKKPAAKVVPLLDNNTDFSVSEAYKMIRTNLMFALHSQDRKSLVITSTAPDEGKSTNCCNLGITLAQTGSRVLIMDCDLRKPVMHKYFNRTRIPGLSELLAGMNQNFYDVIRSTDYPNLDLICGGTIPPNPAELLGSTAVRDLLFSLYQQYDYILLDTPPVNLVSDALSLSAVTDGVVIVVKQRQTTHPELARALSSLTFANAKVLGFILNGGGVKRRYRYSRYKNKGYNDAYSRYAGTGNYKGYE